MKNLNVWGVVLIGGCLLVIVHVVWPETFAAMATLIREVVKDVVMAPGKIMTGAGS